MRSSNDKHWFIGIDGGGTKTIAAICDESGSVKAVATGGASNALSRPWLEVEHTIRHLVEEVILLAGARHGELDALYVGLAGADRFEIKQKIHAAFVDQWEERLHIDNDAVPALYSGTWGQPGIVLIAGTGSIAYALTGSGERHRVGGWGYLVGDEGSGFDLGRQAATAVLRAYDGRGESTALTGLFLAHYGITRSDELIARIYGAANPRKELAETSELVEKAAAEGDTVAAGIIQQAAASLVELADTCLVKTGERVPVVFAGGLLTAETMLRQQVQKRASFAFVIPAVPPVIGALVAAMTGTGRRVDGEVRVQLEKSGTDLADS